MTTNRVGYARVSSDKQTHQLQLDALADCHRVFTETVSGGRHVHDRSQLMAALDYLRTGDQLVVWRLDRLSLAQFSASSDTLPHLLRIVAMIEDKGADFESIMENLETKTLHGTCWRKGKRSRRSATLSGSRNRRCTGT